MPESISSTRTRIVALMVLLVGCASVPGRTSTRDTRSTPSESTPTSEQTVDPEALTSAQLLAPRNTCGRDDDPTVPVAAQLDAITCLVNHARARVGRPRLVRSALLDRTAQHKAEDMKRCRAFEHDACGRPTSYWFRELGYLSAPSWAIAENIGYGTGPLATPRHVVRGWLDSPGHRRNILRADFVELGLGRITGANFEGARVPDGTFWVQHFGRRG